MAKGWINDRERNYQRGDTLVEVAIAISVLGLMLAASMAVINNSLLTVMNATERTAVRSQIDSQAELLRYAWNNNVVASDGKTFRQSVSSQLVETDNAKVNSDERKCGVASGKSFWLAKNTSAGSRKDAVKYLASNTSTGGSAAGSKPTVADYVQFTPQASPDNKPAGIWIDAYTPATTGGTTDGPQYIDFYIRACWTPYGSPTIGSGRMQTVVRFKYSEDTI